MGVEFKLKRRAMVKASGIAVTQVEKVPDILLKSSIEVSWVPWSAEILEAEYPITLLPLLRPSSEHLVHCRSCYHRLPLLLLDLYIDIYTFIER